MAVIKSIRNVLESLSLLLEEHLKLLQKELSEELLRFLGSFFGLLLCLLPLLFGYVFVNIGLVFVLRLLMPIWAALLLMGLLNFVLGGLGIRWAAQRLGSLKFMPETMKELFVTRRVILKDTQPAEQGEPACENAASRRDDAGA